MAVVRTAAKVEWEVFLPCPKCVFGALRFDSAACARRPGLESLTEIRTDSPDFTVFSRSFPALLSVLLPSLSPLVYIPQGGGHRTL